MQKPRIPPHPTTKQEILFLRRMGFPAQKKMKTIDLKNLRITVEHFVSLPLTVTDYICEVVDKLGPAGAYIKPGIVDTDEQERDCHQFFLKYYRQLGNDLEEERIYYPFVTNINDIDIINMIVKYFYDDNYAAEILHFANDEIRDSSDVIVRYPETSSDSDDSDRREIVLPIDSSIIDDYGDFDALEKLAELMQEKGLTQDDLLVVLNAVKLKNIEK